MFKPLTLLSILLADFLSADITLCVDTFSTCKQHKQKYCKDSIGPVSDYEQKIRKRFQKNCRKSCGLCDSDD